jgi:molybdate transport system ATP-binding protein
MTLWADFSLRLGTLELDVELSAPARAVTAVLGPNGAGKSTILAVLAGHLAIDTGSVTLDGRTLDAPPDTFVPPEHRHMGIVHQDYLLFPHLTALDNVAFGPRAAGRSSRDARARAADLLERVGVASHAGARPRELSGGQAQRVALARALATDPATLLLDEPLAALDAGTRVDVRRDLRRYLLDFPGPTLLVTHDPIDALALADHVAILEAGRLTQTGTIAEVTSRPRSRYVADLIGTNLVHGDATGTTVATDTGLILAAARPQQGEVFVTIAPGAIALHHRQPEGSPRNRWPATVERVDRLGDRVRVRLAPPVGLVAEITPAAAAELALGEGDEVWASVKATEIMAFPR